MARVDIEEALRNFDIRLRRVEILLAAKAKRQRDVPPGFKRPVGRPKGSENLPRITLPAAPPLFSEHRLDGPELLAHQILQGWISRSAPRRARVLCVVVLDDDQWKPVKGNDASARAWERLTSLRAYCQAINELPALAEALALAEGAVVDDVEQMRRGLRLLREYATLQIPKGTIGPSAVAAE